MYTIYCNVHSRIVEGISVSRIPGNTANLLLELQFLSFEIPLLPYDSVFTLMLTLLAKENFVGNFTLGGLSKSRYSEYTSNNAKWKMRLMIRSSVILAF